MTAEDPVRTLVVLRHAKSEWPPGVPDHDRPLGLRGVRDAPVAGRWIAAHVGTPDHAVVSSALRTQQTYALAAAEFDPPPVPVTEPGVYAAPATRLLAVLHDVPSDVGTCLLVGHNPGCEDLVALLAGERDPVAAELLSLKYPTAGTALLRFTGSWADLAPGEARLVAFAVPRG